MAAVVVVMLKPIALVLICQLAGEVLARASGWPVPGPVIGFIGLFLLLTLVSGARPDLVNGALDPSPRGALGSVADRLLSVLGLLFVPAGVGIVERLSSFSSHWAELIVVLVLSVLATLLATVAIFLAVARLASADGQA